MASSRALDNLSSATRLARRKDAQARRGRGQRRPAGPRPSRIRAAPAHSTTGQTLRFTGQTTQLTSIDLPPAGFGQGDEVVFHDQLVRDGAVIGHDGGSCQATFAANGQVPPFQCLITFVFGDGQITTEGLLDIANPASFTGNLAVTGGTGNYQLARGQGTVQQTSATIATITLTIAA